MNVKATYHSQETHHMPKFRILTPAGLSFSNSGGGYNSGSSSQNL